MRYLKLCFFLCLVIGGFLWGATNHITRENSISLLEHSQYYLDKEGYTLEEIRSKNLWVPYEESLMHTGISQDTIWLKFSVENSTEWIAHRILLVHSSRAEDITLYQHNGRRLGYRGVSYRKGFQDTLYPFFRVKIAPYSKRVFFLKVRSSLSPMLFAVTLDKENAYRKADKRDQLMKVLFLGIIFGLMIYSFVLSLYTRDKSYLYYGLYLFAVLYQQIGYMGLSQIYLPLEWVELEKKLVLPKVGLILVTTALFAMYFLQTRTIIALHRGYQAIMLLGIVEILVLGVVEYLNPDTIVWVGKLFVTLNVMAALFNLIGAIVYYRRGNRQARLYIVGFSVLFVTYLVWTLGTLGWNTFIYHYPNTIIIGTTIEALILSLAFADRYRILQDEKSKADQRVIEEVTHREHLVQEEVIRKTTQLKQAHDTKALLLQEVHHRVKNNLQIILSMIRLQRKKSTHASLISQLAEVESRINAIAKTYSMLLVGENLAEVDMQVYITALLEDLRRTIDIDNKQIEIITTIHATVPLRESAYIGLVINELVTNAYKYAFDGEGGAIQILLTQKEKMTELIVEDNGRGYVYDPESRSLGLKLIRTLVTNQLRGTIEVDNKGGTWYLMRFEVLER